MKKFIITFLLLVCALAVCSVAHAAIFTGGNGSGWSYSQGGSAMYHGGSGAGESMAGMNSDITLGYAAATQLVFTTSPSATEAGVAFNPQPVVGVWDALGNTVTSAVNAITLSIGYDPAGGSTLGGTKVMNAVAGVANFTGKGLNIDKPGVAFVLSASAAGLAAGSSSAFNITAGSLSSWNLNMNSRTLTLNFSESAQASSLVVTGFTVQDASTATKSYTLTNSTTSSGNGTSIVINLSTADFNGIAAIDGLAKSQSNSYLSMNSGSIQTLLGSNFLAIANGSAIQVTNYTADTTHPTLSSWSLNMNAYTLTLNFSEAVRVSTLSVGALTIQNAATATTSYTLTNSTSSSSNGTSIVINLSTVDFNAIAENTSLATSISNSFLTLTSSAIQDGFGNNVTAVTTGLQAASFTANTVTATTFKVTTTLGASSTTVQVGVTEGITIKAYDSNGFRAPAYSGDKTLIFSGSNNSPDGSSPVAMDKNSSYVNFATGTVITFSNGQGGSTLMLYCRADAGSPALIKATEGAVSTPNPNGLSITVTPGVKTKLAYTQQPSATGTINVALAQQPIVQIRDTYGNHTDDTDSIKLWASTSPTAFIDAGGTVANSTVNAVAGVATFSGVAFNNSGIIYLQAQATGLIAAFSNAITLSIASTSTVEVAAQPVSNFNLIPTNETEANKFTVLKFQVKDAGGDLTPTLIDRIKIAITGTGGNAATDIAWAELRSSYGGDHRVAVAVSIDNNYITFGSTPNGDSIAQLDSVADNSSVEYTVNIYMKSGQLTATDGNTYIFSTNETLIGTDTATSSQMSSNTNKVAAVIGTITVNMTHFEIVDAATGNATVSMTAGQTDALKIRATDDNHNIAKSYGGPTGANHTLIFSGLNTVGAYAPKIGNTAFGNNITIPFTNGQSNANAVTLTAYKSETGNVSVAEYSVSPAYAVYTCAVTTASASASSIALASGNNQNALIGRILPLPFVATVSDSYGNPVQGTSVTFAVSSYPNGAGGYSVSPTSSTSNSSGQASTYLTLGTVGGQYQATATSVGLSGSPVTFTASATAPAALNKVSGDSQSAVVGQPLSQFVVKLVDSTSAPISGETINFAITSYPSLATGQVLSASSAVTDSNGQANTILTLGNKIGNYVVRASYSSLTPADFTATATVDIPYKVVLSGPTYVNAGSPSSAFTISVQDQFGNASNVSQDTVFNLSTSPSIGAFYSDSGCTNTITQSTVANGNSSATFYYKDLVVNNITVLVARSSGQSLTITSASQALSIGPTNLDHFTVTATDSTTMTAGDSRAIYVNAYDTYNNLATNFSGSMSLTFSGANSSPSGQAPTCSNIAFGTANNFTFSTGVATTTLKLYKVESVLIKATSGGITTSGANGLNLTVKSAAADHLKFHDNFIGTETAGVQFNFGTTLDAVDLYGNICDGTNGGDAYTYSSKTIGWALSGASNGPQNGTDAFTNPVNFSAGRSTTTLQATLYRAQNTTITPSVTGLNGTNTPSNSITVNPASVSQLTFSQQPSTTCITTQALAQQPQVSISDQFGNAATNVSGQVTLSASTTTGSYTAAVNGTLSATGAGGLTQTTSNGIATFSGVKYTYPEGIYLQASAIATGYSLSAIYSYKITFSAAAELTTSLVTSGISSTVSSLANTDVNKVSVFAFNIADAGADGLDGVIRQIVINRSASDTSSDWTTYINTAFLTDGTNAILGTVQANKITFGTGASTIFTVPNNSNKTYTLSITLKNPLPLGADGKLLGFSMNALTDITLGSITTSGFVGTTSALQGSATVAVVATRLVITGNSSMNAGTDNLITITAEDANNNIDKDYSGNKSLTFSGASIASSGTKPTCTNYVGTANNFGDSTAVTFTNGSSSSTVDMKLYAAEVAVIAVTDGTISASGADRLSVTVSGGTAAKLFWYTQPIAKVAANAPWKPFVASVTDAYGNTASSTVSITVTPTGGNTTAGATSTVTASGGLATFTNYAVYCPAYPGTVTLNATAPGLTDSGPSNPVTVSQNYAVTINVKDSVSGTQLTNLGLTILGSSGTVSYGPTTGNSPFTLALPYGTYTINLTKDAYVDYSIEETAGVAADGADGVYDNTIAWTLYMTSTVEANSDYVVNSSFVYDELNSNLVIRGWLTKRGNIVFNNDLNKLGTATVQIYDDTTGVWFNTLTLTAPLTTDYTNNTFTTTVNNLLSATNSLGAALVSGRTYFAKVKISYGGLSGNTNLYEGDTTFTVTITQELSSEIIGKIGLAAGQTIASTLASTQATLQSSISSAQSSIESKVSAVKSDTALTLTATQTTIPAAVQTVTDVVKSQILNRENTVRSGQTLTVRYRTYSGLAPTVDVYDANHIQRISKAGMKEIGNTGIYEYNVTFLTAWGKGDFTVVCSEPTKGTIDALTISVLNTDIEQVSGQVSAILGSTAGISGLNTLADTLSSQFNVIEGVLSQMGKNVTKEVKDAVSSSTALESVSSQLNGIANKIKEITGATGINLDKLYQVSGDKKQDIVYLKNKTQEIKAAIELNQKIADNIANKPVTQSWYEYK